MTMRAYKFRIYPNAEQTILLAKHFGCARFVYNWALSEKKKHDEASGKSLSKRALQDALVASKKADKDWLNEVNSQSLLASLNNLDKAFSNFSKGLTKFPRFKSKYAGPQSFQCPQHTQVDHENAHIHLPKLKGIKAKLHRNFTGKIKTVTVTRSASNKYFASVLIDEATQVPIPTTIEASQTLGLDVGLEHLLIDSEGRKVDNPRYYRQALKRLAIEQRKLARQQKGSSNRAQQRRRVARVHERVANQRNNFIHQITARLVGKGHATTFAVEDLNVKGMVKNRKLSRAIQDVGWGMLLTTLEYKCRWNGKNLIRIGRFEPSSKLCNRCGYQASIMPLSVRQWCCPACQWVHDRDINAAKNIRDFALADVLGHSACIKSSPATQYLSA